MTTITFAVREDRFNDEWMIIEEIESRTDGLRCDGLYLKIATRSTREKANEHAQTLAGMFFDAGTRLAPASTPEAQRVS